MDLNVAYTSIKTESAQSHTQLNEKMIEDFPVADIHVHVPGTVTPQTAWELGVRNKLITVVDGKDGKTWRNGDVSLDSNDPHEHYADIFREKDSIMIDQNGKPQNIEYDIDHQSFKIFDQIMATVQGHRNPPGGIQTEEDFKLVLRNYLQSCITQKIFYTELQQNIRIAYQLYPNVSEVEARKKFILMLRGMQDEFAECGVHVRFLHCFNKTGMAKDGKTPHERAIEGAN